MHRLPSDQGCLRVYCDWYCNRHAMKLTTSHAPLSSPISLFLYPHCSYFFIKKRKKHIWEVQKYREEFSRSNYPPLERSRQPRALHHLRVDRRVTGKRDRCSSSPPEVAVLAHAAFLLTFGSPIGPRRRRVRQSPCGTGRKRERLPRSARSGRECGGAQVERRHRDEARRLPEWPPQSATWLFREPRKGDSGSQRRGATGVLQFVLQKATSVQSFTSHLFKLPFGRSPRVCHRRHHEDLFYL